MGRKVGEFIDLGFCARWVYSITGAQLGLCTREPGHRGGCTHVLLNPRDRPHGHVMHNLRR